MKMNLVNRIKTSMHLRSGFTLVELMVSLTIFSIVILVCGSTLLILVDVNAKAQALYSSTTNLSFALDSITREIRTGSKYYCSVTIRDDLRDDTQDGENCKYIAFTRQRDGKRVAYRLKEESAEVKVIEQRVQGGVWTPMTSSDVVVDIFEIDLRHSAPHTDFSNTPFVPGSPGDTHQPTIDILIRGKVNNGLSEPTEFNIQTRMVSRPSNAI